ncbi:Glycoside hydrolase/deacetylase, beta/alpha-barrel [Niveomyces insectorum RCEF 264]|uniref:Glycoside hydrolase/deacetylase, beta/alpha-barrel n=1 Tax=Niveomyces insectorum RCEF 264 TaxID=1081102 RepID=A0A167S324_9HYPO|nr:Glycoside hydrolase/deacetylase, beta/alpha-barrel [Niveomyces insectorum RCEF 264]
MASTTYTPDPVYDTSRDLVGYSKESLHPKWPNGAKIAISFVVNYEEGGENSVLYGDQGSEWILREGPGLVSHIGQRDPNAESEYEYGSRAGIWRLLRFFNAKNLKFTLYAVGKALEGNPRVGVECVEHGHEIAAHAYRWIDYTKIPLEEEKALIKQEILSLQQTCGVVPKGWYYGRPSRRSRILVWQVFRELGYPLLWNSDTYADDVPYWTDVPEEADDPNAKGLLLLPYSFDNNDYKFTVPSGFNAPGGWLEHLKNTFDTLYQEGIEGMPKMMTVGLHCRLAGRPGRFAALKSFVEYVQQHEGVWITTRTNIAEAFSKEYPYKKGHLA